MSATIDGTAHYQRRAKPNSNARRRERKAAGAEKREKKLAAERLGAQKLAARQVAASVEEEMRKLTEKFRHCYRTETILASVADRAKGCLEYWRRHLDRLASIAYPFRPQEEVDGIRQALKYSADEIWDRAFANHCASRPAVGMQFVLDRAIALVPLELPAYVVLQILDYTPGIETLDELTKVTMISSVRNWRHVSQRMPAVLLRLAAMAREELTSCGVVCQAAARCGREARELATQCRFCRDIYLRPGRRPQPCPCTDDYECHCGRCFVYQQPRFVHRGIQPKRHSFDVHVTCTELCWVCGSRPWPERRQIVPEGLLLETGNGRFAGLAVARPRELPVGAPSGTCQSLLRGHDMRALAATVDWKTVRTPSVAEQRRATAADFGLRETPRRSEKRRGKK